MLGAIPAFHVGLWETVAGLRSFWSFFIVALRSVCLDRLGSALVDGREIPTALKGRAVATVDCYAYFTC